MNILLDTCSFLWITLDPDKMSATAKSSFENPANTIYLSSITSWEIGIKYNLGKLITPAPPHIFIPEELNDHNISTLELSEKDTFHLDQLPPVHKDPFDRILICQAIENGLTILTSDAHIHRYPVKTMW